MKCFIHSLPLQLTESYLKVVDNVISVDTVVLTESQTVSNTSAKYFIMHSLIITTSNTFLLIDKDLFWGQG